MQCRALHGVSRRQNVVAETACGMLWSEWGEHESVWDYNVAGDEHDAAAGNVPRSFDDIVADISLWRTGSPMSLQITGSSRFSPDPATGRYYNVTMTLEGSTLAYHQAVIVAPEPSTHLDQLGLKGRYVAGKKVIYPADETSTGRANFALFCGAQAALGKSWFD